MILRLFLMKVFLIPPFWEYLKRKSKKKKKIVRRILRSRYFRSFKYFNSHIKSDSPNSAPPSWVFKQAKLPLRRNFQRCINSFTSGIRRWRECLLWMSCLTLSNSISWPHIIFPHTSFKENKLQVVRDFRMISYFFLNNKSKFGNSKTRLLFFAWKRKVKKVINLNFLISS